MQKKIDQQLKKNQQLTFGEKAKNDGFKEYNALTGVYGLFAVADRLQSAVTGCAATNEVAKIREGEAMMAKANTM